VIKEWSLGLIANPVLNIRKPSPGQGRNRRLNDDEEVRLLKACGEHSNPFLGWIVRITLYTSMRKSEITSLTREQINLKKRTIFLPGTKNGSVRTVPLTSKAYLAVKEALSHPIRSIDTKPYLLRQRPPTKALCD